MIPKRTYRHFEPDEEEVFVPTPRKRVSRRPRRDPRDDRLSPSQRAGARFITVSVPADAYVKLKEIAAFRKISLARAVAAIVDPVFDEVYKESLLMMRIDQTRKKEREKIEAQRRANAARKSDV